MSHEMRARENVMVADMADHYRKSCELLQELDDLRVELKTLHQLRPHDTKKIAQTYDSIRQLTAIAKVHAQLAQVQATTDVAMRPPVSA